MSVKPRVLVCFAFFGAVSVALGAFLGDARAREQARDYEALLEVSRERVEAWEATVRDITEDRARLLAELNESSRALNNTTANLHGTIDRLLHLWEVFGINYRNAINLTELYRCSTIGSSGNPLPGLGVVEETKLVMCRVSPHHVVVEAFTWVSAMNGTTGVRMGAV